jgi:hypothetical protein
VKHPVFPSTTQLIIVSLPSHNMFQPYTDLMMDMYGRDMLREEKGTIINCIIDENILYEINEKVQKVANTVHIE